MASGSWSREAASARSIALMWRGWLAGSVMGPPGLIPVESPRRRRTPGGSPRPGPRPGGGARPAARASRQPRGPWGARPRPGGGGGPCGRPRSRCGGGGRCASGPAAFHSRSRTSSAGFVTRNSLFRARVRRGLAGYGRGDPAELFDRPQASSLRLLDDLDVLRAEHLDDRGHGPGHGGVVVGLLEDRPALFGPEAVELRGGRRQRGGGRWRAGPARWSVQGHRGSSFLGRGAGAAG